MIHKNSVKAWFARPSPMRMPLTPGISQDHDGFGVDTGTIAKRTAGRPKGKLPPMHTVYPGLGSWSPQRKWRRILLWPWLRRYRPGPLNHPVQGIDHQMMMMPGVFRVPNHPSADNMYYEWYLPVDEEHYLYGQITCLWGKSPLARAWQHFWYYLFGKWTGVIQFNNQDLAFTRQTTNFTRRHGKTSYPMVKISRNDDFHTAWRQFASEFARGEGYAFDESYNPEESPLVDMVASVPWLEKDEPKEAAAPQA